MGSAIGEPALGSLSFNNKAPGGHNPVSLARPERVMSQKASWLHGAVRRGVSLLPRSLIRRLRDRWHVYQAVRGRLGSDEPEFHRLAEWLKSGDAVIDVGANIGAYTLRMSQIVGPTGRVYAFEPIPDTFASLTRNLRAVGATNVTLFNAACGEETSLVGMSVPDDPDGLPNPYLAHISKSPMALNALCVQVDALQLRERIALVKIDAEGFDDRVVFGMRKLLARSLPRIIIESRNAAVESTLAELGYVLVDDPKSPNALFEAKRQKPQSESTAVRA